MGQVLFIVWRESVEALLVVGILYAWLNNGDAAARRGLPYLWAGVVAGVIAAVVLGGALLGFSELLSGDAQTYFQIGMVLIAAVLIVQMVFWMRKHGRTLKKDMESSLKASTEAGNWWGVFALVALAIAREGSETAVFLYGIGMGEQDASRSALIFAGVIGFALAFLTFYLLQLGGKIFSWRRFFQVTEIILLLLAAGLLLTGVEKLLDLLLESSDWFSSLNFVSSLTAPVWDTSWLLDDSSTLGSLVSTLTGYRARPALMSVAIYVIYWLVVSSALGKLKNTQVNKQAA
ncbi:FTR1 family iron permease [Herbaspirillum sp. meg3]|jgi:high-affinity iron transporter|uniref:FTR1 family iron permease n=1 Tax=Herbaspirillum sp. meg3 TaxID=2025949 RepID=UPI000B98C9E5|nr:FTR1 family protein [Herbaspirillum sp. meg3]ASU38492.1 FTR1 family iron permease [Herbaspirillum sp. meg3]